MSGLNVVDVGTPPSGWKEWQVSEVRFHNFANLSTERDAYEASPVFSSLGFEWVLVIYPGGEEDSAEGYTAIRLSNRSDKSIKIDWGVSVKDVDGKEVHHEKPYTVEIAARGSNGNAMYGYSNFAERPKIMKSLVNGALVVEVRMRLADTDKSTPSFIPLNPICKNVINKFMHEESADVVFEVVGSESETSTTFYAHRFILQDVSTTLAELSNASDGGVSTPIVITDIKPDIFRHMLYYMYGGKLTDEDLGVNAKDIIDACDKYGVVHLKLEAEATYVLSTTTDMDNMMENLIYADTKNLALLKEAVMDYIVANKNSIIGKASFDNVPGTMMMDLLTAVARVDQVEEDDDDSEGINYKKLRVGTLRKMLDDKGLDVDGSREAMISLLEE